MNPAERQAQALRLFDELCDLPPGERATYLDQNCPDAELRATVEAMLASDEETGSFLDDTQAPRALDEMAAHALGEEEEAPTQVGPYRILREVARGGMGIIYEARQDAPDRRVALKVLQAASIDRSMLRRFQQEAQVLGQLQHPGIAQVYEAGFADTSQGRKPFFAMEFIEGQPLDVHAREQQLGIRQRLELMARVCDALQHAHQKGVIHRDLKPANVLVLAQATTTGTVNSATAIDAIGMPKVLDFGIARITDPDHQPATLQTEVGQLIGTLAYMSPEQLQGASADLDTRCDVYALGVMLYEILGERRPHELNGLSIAVAARRVQEEEPALLGSILPGLRGDIETIVAKTLEKDRERRYGSAAELAADIRRYLNDEPILARPATTMYLLNRFVRRNKALVGGAVATLLMLIVALIGTGYGLVQAESQRKAAVEANEQLQTVIDYQSAMLSTVDVEQMGQRWVEQVRSEASRLAEQNPQTSDRLVALESMLSEINATTLASRVLDESILSRAVGALDEGFADQPQLQASLRGSLVEIYQQIGLRPEALVQARQKHQTYMEEFGVEHPESLRALQVVADLLLENEQFDEALFTLEELLEVQKRVSGPDDVDTLRTERMVGVAQRRLSRIEEARSTLEAVVVRYVTLLGPEHEETMQARLDLADYYYQQRELAPAMAEFRTVLDWREEALGPDDPGTLTVVGRIGNVLFLQNNYTEALAMTERHADALERTKGGDHPATLAARYRVANVLTNLGASERAEAVLNETLERQKEVLGPDHPARVEALSSGLRLGLNTKRWDLAEAYGREALDVALRTLGPDNVRTLDAQHDLTAVYLKSEQHEMAIRTGRAALAEYVRVLGAEHTRTGNMQQTLAKSLISAGAFEEASAELDTLLEICRRVHPTSSLTAGTLGQAVNAFVNADRADDARQCAEELLAWCTARGLGANTLTRCHLWLDRAKVAQGEWEQAQASLNTAVELVKGTQLEQAWSTTLARIYLELFQLQADPAHGQDAVQSLYQRFREQSVLIRSEDRNAIFHELKRLFAALGVDAS